MQLLVPPEQYLLVLPVSPPACRLFSALEQRLPQLSGPALALLTASLPQLLPAGGNLRLWRQLGGVVQAHGSSLNAEQLCEVLPLVQAADLPLPVEWLTQCMQKIEVGGWAVSVRGMYSPLLDHLGVRCLAYGTRQQGTFTGCEQQLLP